MAVESSAVGTISRGRITYFPVVPGRIEFALRVRRYLLEHRPGVVAVELPSSLEQQYRAALDRMPQMSLILIADADAEGEERATYIPVEPGDPFVEAIRTAREIEAQIVFLEPATHEKPHISGAYPEPHSVELIGMAPYVEAYRVHPQRRTPPIELHAAAMAWKLQGADPFASACAVGGGWITYVLTDGPAAGLMVYVAEDITPTVQVGQHVSSSTVIGDMFAGSDGIETGWAQPGGLSAESQLPEAGGIDGYGPFPTRVGLNFDELLQSLGVPPAPNRLEFAYGLLPAAYPVNW